MSLIPLIAGTWFGGPRLAIEVAPSNVQGGWLPKQRLVLDTGSSTLAFCDSQLRQDALYEASSLMACNIYGFHGDDWDVTGYFGPFVKGPAKIGNFTMPEASYSIMQQESGMPCSEGLDGIFGIARQCDQAFRKEDESKMQFTEEGNFICPHEPVKNEASPLMQLLSSQDSQKLGIYWSGQEGEGQGSLFLGQSAVENEHFTRTADPLAATLGEVGPYDIQVEAIDVKEQQITGLTCDRSKNQPCMLDTGTPSIVLPSEAYELVQAQDGEGNLTFKLAGPNGPTSLTFDLQRLNQMGAISKGAKGAPLVLGLPVWAFYYTVFDLQEKQVIFVPTQPSEVQENVTDTSGANTPSSVRGPRPMLRGSVQS